MRLTKKYDDNSGYEIVNEEPREQHLYIDLNGYEEIKNKLGRLEDIEELCEKVVEKPIYEKYIDTNEIHKEDYTECSALYSFKHNRIELYIYDFVNYLELDQYGKTWALTKEELE